MFAGRRGFCHYFCPILCYLDHRQEDSKSYQLACSSSVFRCESVYILQEMLKDLPNGARC
jgi:hypothetical protein